MKSLLILVFLTTFSLTVSAQTNEETEGPGKNADFICHQDGGGVAFKVESRTEKARMWQIDEIDGTGIEFKVTRFSVFRCPGCYTFEATYTMEDIGSVKVRGNVENFKLTYDVFDNDEKQWVTVLDKLMCKKNTHRN